MSDGGAVRQRVYLGGHRQTCHGFHRGAGRLPVLTPFGGEDREIVSTYLVTDTVIVGTVPERYAYRRLRL
ncbi:MAG: hypothetical protein ACLT4C_06210 [Butyricicoccus sp.]